MTHNDPPIIHPFIYSWTLGFYTLSDMYVKFAYGVISIDKSDDSNTILELDIKDIDGLSVFYNAFNLNRGDLEYHEEMTRY